MKNKESLFDKLYEFIMSIDLDKLEKGVEALTWFIQGQPGKHGALSQIAKERYEQIHKHGHTVETDAARNDVGELGDAARYCLTLDNTYWPHGWSSLMRAKISIMKHKDRLVLSAAFLAAEVDRIEWAERQREGLVDQVPENAPKSIPDNE